jgi:2TM domain
MDDANRQFTSDEVSAIVRRALQSQVVSDSISYADLLDIAQQSGISESALRQAMEEEDTLGALERAKEAWLWRRKSAFFRHLRTYCIVNGFLFLLNVITNPGGHLWVVWPILGWGIGVAFSAADAFFPSHDRVERGARHLLRRQQRRQEREPHRYD